MDNNTKTPPKAPCLTIRASSRISGMLWTTDTTKYYRYTPWWSFLKTTTEEQWDE